ncbi:protein DpdH [Sneathiella sp.]|uniref:protein DpdH n=1 Tax=Sneathiella sp. TaxID=1964365 RepID=UPI003564397C
MLESYWPKAPAVNACIKNEAETADVSVLLAVHQPSQLARRSAATGNSTPATEKDLLDAFLTDNVPSGALLMPITGPSGVGKSHIVRWLDAQLRRSAKREQLHIIRIPKSASLRTVVELILEPLKDDARYIKAHNDLTRAVAEVNLQEAVITFRAHLQNALAARRANMVAEIRDDPERRHLKALIGHADKLPLLFADGALEQHFVQNVLSKVVSRALRGRTEDQDDDDALPQFVASDLVLPETVPINQASLPVRDYYQRNIANVEIDQLQPVVDLLNDAVDTAIGNVFKLEQNAGGMTLQDIILAVREILFADGMDLVLLVEDFAALAGIQEVLLKVCIQEGESEGKKVRATMRTAMALTDGYLSFRDTIMTRAQREWVVGGGVQTDDEIRAGVVGMVGAYLNAARWGDTELRRLFNKRDPEQSLTDWLPAWRGEDLSDEESKAVTAFGYTEKEEALFPFNRQAIEQLVDRHLILGGKLVFNPRRVINEIIRNTLLMRPTFEAHAFPPASYEGLSPNANLANWIRQTHQPDEISRRLGSLLAAWGGNPLDTSEIAHIPPSVFKAFSLPTPEDLANIRFVPEPERPKLSIKPAQNGGVATPSVEGEPSIAVAKPAEDPRVVDLRGKLDAWSKGAQLAQNDARSVRTALFEMLKHAIDLPSLRIRDGDLRPQWITIPSARGNPQSGLKLHVCDNPLDEDGTVRAGLIAAVRFNLNGNRWTYPAADDDYVASAALIDHLVAQLRPKWIEDAKAQVSALGRALITQSRIAGLSPPVKPSSAAGIFTGLFAVPEVRTGQSFDENWDNLYTDTLGPRARDMLQAELIARCGCFQGSGRTLNAVDVVRLMDAISGEASAGETSDGLPEEIKAYIRSLSENRIRRRLTSVISKLSTFQTQITEFIETDFDKAGFVDDLQAIVLLLAKTGTTPSVGPNLKEFERQLIEFKQSAFVNLVAKAGVITKADGDQTPGLLNALGSIDLGLIARTMSFLQKSAELIAAAETNVTREEGNRSQSDPKDLILELNDMLSLVAGLSPSEKEAAS